MSFGQRARRDAALILCVRVDTGQRHVDVEIRHREGMRGVVGIDPVFRRAVDRLDAAGGAADAAEEGVAQAAGAVVLVDRHIYERVRRHLEERRVLPLPFRILGHVADPVRERVMAVAWHRLERQTRRSVADNGGDRRRPGLEEEDEVDDDEPDQDSQRRRDR